ncbi:TIGR03086 family metal-binding protein [Pseudonocardia sp. DLS-67]
MTARFDELIDRYVLTSAEFEQRLRRVRADQWTLPTPCSEWNVRDLVNHMARGNLNYVRLIGGATSAEFLRLRDADALGADPVAAYARSVRECAAAFAAPGAVRRTVDYPLGRVTGRQALAVRTTDSTIHTWDLARAIGAEDTLDAGLVRWIDDHLDEIYAGLAETPVSLDSTHRFFAAPQGEPGSGASRQDRLLHRMGRTITHRPGHVRI